MKIFFIFTALDLAYLISAYGAITILSKVGAINKLSSILKK